MRSRSLLRWFAPRPRFPDAPDDDWPSLPESLCLEGDRILLRWPRLADAEAVFAYASDEEVNRFMDWVAHRSVEDSRRFLATLEQARRRHREIAFGIIERESGHLLGICSFVRRRDAESVELGYTLRRSAWGKGIMTEAVRLACDWIVAALPLEEIYAEVHPDNVASQRVLEKSGFVRQPDGVYRSIKGHRSLHYHYVRPKPSDLKR